jgi:hypothetical protein
MPKNDIDDLDIFVFMTKFNKTYSTCQEIWKLSYEKHLSCMHLGTIHSLQFLKFQR